MPAPLPTRRAVLAATLPLPALAQAGAELRVGAVFPAASLIGDEALRGVEFAVEERNAANGGRAVRLVRGEAADAAQALAEARRLAEAERCVVIFGSVSAAAALAAAQACEAAEVPYVELVVPAEALLERGFRQFVRLAPRAGDFALVARDALTTVVSPALATPTDALQMALLHESSPSAESLAEVLEARLREAGMPVLERLSHAPRSAELPALVARLRAAGVSGLIHAGGEADIVALLRAMRAEGWRPRVLMGLGPAWGLVHVARLAGAEIDGALAVDVPPSPGAAAGAAAFAEGYARRWGSPPRAGTSFAAYAAARQALAGPLAERGALRAWLAAADVPEGALANGWGVRLDARGQNTRARPVAMQWRDGRPQAVFPPSAATLRFAP